MQFIRKQQSRCYSFKKLSKKYLCISVEDRANVLFVFTWEQVVLWGNWVYKKVRNTVNCLVGYITCLCVFILLFVNIFKNDTMCNVVVKMR